MILMLILMLFPLIGILVFWVLPPGQAIPVYLSGLLLSALTWWLMRLTHKKPVVTGAESLINRDAEVTSKNGRSYQVYLDGELWTARSSDPVSIGDIVTIVAVDGNRLKVRCKIES